MNWDQVLEWFERVKVILQALSILGPIVFVPAYLWLRRIGSRLRQLYIATPKILTALAIFGNRERRAFDVDRRLLNHLLKLVEQLRYEGKRQDWSLVTLDLLEELHAGLKGGLDKEIQELRDTGFRSREVRAQRELRDQQIQAQGKSAIRIDQGQLDAAVMGPIERVLGD